MKAINAEGHGPYSDPMIFTVGNATPPAQVVLIAPSGQIGTNTPTYEWNAVSNAASYWLYADNGTISKGYSAALAGCGDGTGTCSVTPSTALSDGTTNFLVKAINAEGHGSYSDPMAFSILTGGS